MPTNYKRREAAAELRNYENAYLIVGEYISLKIPCSRLADLIEPEPERTCHIIDYNEETSTSFLSCGHSVCEEHPNYCSECGARVVKKDRLADLKRW